MKGKLINKSLYVIPMSQKGTIVYHIDSGSLSTYPKTVAEIENRTDFSEFYSQKIEYKLKKSEKRDIDYYIVGAAEACNLNCSYCFAGGGTYGHHAKIMNYDDYMVMFNKIINISPNGIRCISFFGGEPLLSFSAIKQFVEYASDYFTDHSLPVPTWGIVTNGTLINQEMIDFFNKHHFAVNISLDGPKEINDKTRVFANNTDSVFDVVANNLKKMKKRDFVLACQATLNKDFFLGYKKNDYSKFINSMYDLGYDYVAPLIAQSKETTTVDSLFAEKIETFYEDMVNYDFDILLNGGDITRISASTLTVIDRLAKPQYYESCEAGIRSAYYSANGEFYTCHLYYGNGNKKISFEEISAKNNAPKYNRLDDYDCANCMAKYICFSWCPGTRVLLEGKHCEASCLAQKKLIESVIIHLIPITQIPEKYNNLIKNYQVAAKRSAEADKTKRIIF